VAEGSRDRTLGSQLTLTQGDGYQRQMLGITQGHAIENLMAAKDDAIAITIVEPHRGIDRSACVFGAGLGVSKERRSSWSCHIKL
jgi:hypothetical protein